MTHTHEGFEHPDWSEHARSAIESHGQLVSTLGPEARKMHEQEHTGVELTAAELAYVRDVIEHRMKTLDREIPARQRLLDEGGVPNTSMEQEDISALTQEQRFLRHNLFEKLSGLTKTPNGTAH
jgi:hypothetical protein